MTNQPLSQNMTLAPGVVDTIISLTVNEMDGVAQIGTPLGGGIRAMLQNKPSTGGIVTSYDDDGKLEVTLHIEVYYGYVLPELAEKIRQAVADALLVQVGIEVSRIDIFVDGIQFAQQ